MLPGGGYLVLAFVTDNPGAWLMHCHIVSLSLFPFVTSHNIFFRAYMFIYIQNGLHF
jgi:drug/metabolite transporter superfamily protein YnfA